MVFEAWETAIETDLLNIDELSGIVEQIDDERVARRVGYMLDTHGVDISARLVEISRVAAAAEPIALFPGTACTHGAGRWNVLTP